METSLILLIVAFLVVVYLIFKFIKKIVFAIISVVVVFILLVGSVFALVYFDLNNLMQNEDYNVKLVYSSNNDYLLGVDVPIENNSIKTQEISGISDKDLDALDVEKVEKDDNLFIVVVPKESLDKLVVKDSYNLKDIQGIDLGTLEDYNLTLTKEEVLEIINSENDIETFVDILLEKNGIKGQLKEVTKPIIINLIKSELDKMNLSFNEAMFAYVLSDSANNSETVLNLLEDYKNEDIKVYPDRFSFKILRMLPVDTVKGFIVDEE